MTLKELDILIKHLEDSDETLLVCFYQNKRRQLVEKIESEVYKKIWDLV